MQGAARIVFCWAIILVACSSEGADAVAPGAQDGGAGAGGVSADGGADSSTWGSSPCGVCVLDGCASPVAACGAEPSCAARLECLEACPVTEGGGAESTCEAACPVATAGTAESAWQAVLTCRAGCAACEDGLDGGTSDSSILN